MPKSQGYQIPSPTGGWNVRDDVTAMAPNDAVSLVNVIPRTSFCQLRQGFRSWSTGLGASVQTLVEYSSISSTRKLIGFANGHAWNSTSSGAAVSLATGFSNDKWSVVHQTGVTGTTFIVCVNGADTPQKYDGTTWSAAAFTGSGLTTTNLTDVSIYKTLKYFVEKNTANIWYDDTVNQITGNLLKFNVGGILEKGGNIVTAGSWTKGTGQVSQELFIALSSMGELLVYSGGSPSTSDWQLVGHFKIPQPLGARPLFQIGGEAYAITELGVISLSVILGNQGLSSSTARATDKILYAFQQAALNYGSTFGWAGCPYPRGRYIIINVPLSTTQSEQYVMRMYDTSGDDIAWTRFTGMNAASWSLYNQNLYFGGTDGTVYQADYGTDDNGAGIDCFIKPAFNSFGIPNNKKFLHMVQPTLIGTAGTSFNVSCDVDFQNTINPATFSLIQGSSSLWDVAKWDVAKWDQGSIFSSGWKTCGAIGQYFAPKLGGKFKGVQFQLSGIGMIFEQGGIF